MENPYWTSDGQEHYVKLNTIKSLCFEICNIFEASKSLANEMSASELLLQVALLVRTYDDQMTNSEKSVEYNNFVKK